MLVALLPDQVDMHWDILKVAIQKCLPPIASHRNHSMNRILENLLSGNMVCWLAVVGGKIEGFLITTVIEDYCTDTKTMLLYAVFGEVDRSVWEAGYETVNKHAKELGCDFIAYYTMQPHVVEIGKSFGCTDQHYVTLEVV
jgi:hypothetical protein